MNIHDKLDSICIKHHGELPSVSEQLENLCDAMIDNIISTSDEEILQEVKDDYGNENFLADKARTILSKVMKK